jgi:hypothetical protein
MLRRMGGGSSKQASPLGSLDFSGMPALPTLANDPTFDMLKSRAQEDSVAELGKMAAGDSASLMARYGTRLALAGQSNATPRGDTTGTASIIAALAPSLPNIKAA